ncbi:MAG: hypothetical protein ACOX0L_02280 [Natronincolaceae bacterium]|mgnify:CR=1 FL=1|jgi:hypothetical protein|nr:hypothetical protein [Bacillota bacterium]NLK90106.1 hypothetical protein [Clostridiales bacterium]
MEIFKDIYYTNRSVSKKALTGIIKNWPIIFTGLFYSTATIMLSMSLGFFGILGGIVSIVVTSALISNYLYLLNTILNRGYFNFQDFKDGFTPYLSKIWSILFIGYVAKLVLDFIVPMFFTVIGPSALSLIITFLTFMLFNPVPEVTYQKHHGPGETIMYSINFVRDNWIEWFVPNIVLLTVFYFISGQSLSIFRIVNSVFNYFVSFTSISVSLKGLFVYIIGQIWFSYFMVYRAYLFETLSTSNRRKRLFMSEF